VPNADLLAGRRFYDQGNLELAERHLLAGLAMAPDSADDHAVLAGLYAKKGWLWVALRESNESLRLNPRSLLVLSFRTEVLLACADIPGAVEAAQRFVAAFPSLTRAHSSLAFALVRARRPQDALRATDEALRLNPTDANAMNARAVALTQLGRPDDGEAVIRDALRRNPNAAHLQNTIGLIQLRRGEALLARESFKSALRADPNQRAASRNLARMRFGIVPVLARFNASTVRFRQRLGAMLAWAQLLVIAGLLAVGLAWPWVGVVGLIGLLFLIAGLDARVSAPWFNGIRRAIQLLPPTLRSSPTKWILYVAFLFVLVGSPDLSPGAPLAVALAVILGSDTLLEAAVGGILVAIGLGLLVAASTFLTGQRGSSAALDSMILFVGAPLASVVIGTLRESLPRRSLR
jgi:tetratricopeptide (TPR) repeat protein